MPPLHFKQPLFLHLLALLSAALPHATDEVPPQSAPIEKLLSFYCFQPALQKGLHHELEAHG